jgi:phage terminase large subunit-like protein
MVQEIIRAAKPGVPYRSVKASRGKVIRAEPIASLFEQQKISLVGHFEALEDQLCAMTTAGYVGSRSPDRADAMIWGLADLFPAMTKRDDGPNGGYAKPTVNLGHANMKARRH